ncbi:MAG: hypothetical protein R2830_16585 [Saprospiraceae bacterium]
MFFPQPFFKILILTALLMMSAGAITLIGMLVKDIQTKRLW